MQVQKQDWNSAQQSLAWSRWLQATSLEADFIGLRIARKLGHQEQFETALHQLNSEKYDPQRLKREVWLMQAQSGDISNLESRLGDLFVAGNDLQEICEAFVLGCLQQYRLDEALQVLDLWEADFPQDAQPHFLRARLLEHRSNYARGSRKSITAAMALNPEHAAAAYGLARVALQSQDYESALKWYELCSKHGISALPGLIGIVRCYRELGKYDLARQKLEEAEAIPEGQQNIDAWKMVGETAESSLTTLFAERGHLELATGNSLLAQQAFQKALEANPFAWRLRYHYGQALIQTKQIEAGKEQIQIFHDAEQALARCDPLIDQLRTAPENVDARFEIGTVMLEYISPNQGLVWLNSVLRYEPDHLKTHQVLAKYFADHIDEHPAYKNLSQKHQRLAQSLESRSSTSESLPTEIP